MTTVCQAVRRSVRRFESLRRIGGPFLLPLHEMSRDTKALVDDLSPYQIQGPERNNRKDLYLAELDGRPA